MVEDDNDFCVTLVAPKTARAACRTGQFLDAMVYADSDTEALEGAFRYAEDCMSGKMSTAAHIADLLHAAST